jgi:hypothetical protein
MTLKHGEKLKRYTRVKINMDYVEGVVQNACDYDGIVDAHRLTISVPGVKGKWWIVIPNEFIEVYDE